MSMISGSDAILLGAETHRGLYPVDTVRTVDRICFEVSLKFGVFVGMHDPFLHNLSYLFICLIFFIQISYSIMQAERVFNQDQYFKKAVKYVGEPMSHLESIGSSAVCSIMQNISFIWALCYSFDNI